MKRFKYFLSAMLIVVSIMCVSCFDSGSSEEDSSNNEGTGGIVKSAKLYDKNNTFLGYCHLNSYSIFIQTPTGYYYELFWDGILSGFTIYYTEKDGAGTAFFAQLKEPYPGKMVSLGYNNQLYTAKNIDSNDRPIDDSSLTHYKSLYRSGSPINNFETPQALYSDYTAIPLKTISRVDAGIPATIALPLRISYE